jgi:hypothetical protein
MNSDYLSQKFISLQRDIVKMKQELSERRGNNSSGIFNAILLCKYLFYNQVHTTRITGQASYSWKRNPFMGETLSGTLFCVGDVVVYITLEDCMRDAEGRKSKIRHGEVTHDANYLYPKLRRYFAPLAVRIIDVC